MNLGYPKTSPRKPISFSSLFPQGLAVADGSPALFDEVFSPILFYPTSYRQLLGCSLRILADSLRAPRRPS